MIETGIISKVKIQDVLSNQLPNFIRDESPDTIDFLKQYYISQEYQGGPSDISDNLDQYLNVDNLTPEVIVDTSTTVGITTIGAEIVKVTSTKGFPNQYGLLKIDNEIITYTGSTPTSFTGCKRGFSGITSYHSDVNKEDLVFSSSSAAEHEDSSTVQNLSSLFLKEFYKKFKTTFLPGLEQVDFQSNLDVGTFIGKARSLYQTKGTEESFRILFNVLYGINPKLINLEERLVKPSFANYVRRRVCVAEILEGNPIKLKGQSILKGLTGQTLFRSDLDLDINASISDIEPFERSGSGLTGITTYYKIGLFVGYDETSDIEGDFVIVPNTKSIEAVSVGSSVISVDSTIGFGVTGIIISGSNTISYTDKTVNQFLGCTATSTGSFNSPIEPTANIRSNITYFGFEDGDLNKKVVLRLTGVLSEFEQEGDLDVEEGEIISIKSIGDKVENPKQNSSYKEIFCNSWIYNTSSSYFSNFSGFSDSEDGQFNLLSKTDPSSLKVGDFVEIVERDSNKIINTGNTSVKTINDNNNITLEGGTFSDIDIKTDYKIRKKLNKASSSGAPIEFGNDVIISDVQNVYVESENAYVSSNSLPSFVNNNFAEFSKQININVNQISLDLSDTDNTLSGDTGDQTDFSTINFKVNHNFDTGDKVFYTYTNGDSLVGLDTGIYFIDKIGDKSIRLFGSPSGIADGKNITFSKSDNDGIHNFVLFSHKSGEIGAQKLIKKFPLSQNLNIGNNDSTPTGQIGMLKNGVEISNYKSEDKMFFGPLTEVNVLNGGENFDVINPPIISVSSGIGITALVQPVVSGKVEDVFIDTQSFDVDKVISIGVTGGNGSGCILESVIGIRFREELFNAQPTTSGGGISTIVTGNPVSRITFDRDHNFINSEPIIYDSNSNPEVIVGIGTSTLINQSIYYPEIVNSRSIKLYESLSDLSSGIGTVKFYGGSSGKHIFKVGLRNTLLGVNVIDGGKNYTNRNLFVKPSGISTSDNKINFVNHGFTNGDLVNYSTLAGLGSDKPQTISGLSTSLSYYILKDDDNSFRLANAGIGGTITTNFERNKNVSLESTGTGFQSFSYPEIKIIANFTSVGIGTSPVVREITATPKVRGTIQQTYLYETGTGYGSTIINNHKKPIITLKNGKDASIKPIIINGKIDSVIINYVGQEYFSSPDLDVIDPTGLGAGAKLKPIIADGKISDVQIINAGIGYSTSTSINVKSAGQNAFFDSSVRALTLNKHDGNTNELLEESMNKLKYSFTGYSTSLLGNSGLIGWAYDGNPIYGPFGSKDPQQLSPLDTKLKSGYSSNDTNIVDRPPNFSIGHFIEDFKYDNSNGDLDEHNGRFEVTAEFPNGVYAYHATIDNQNKPEFPYFVGNTFRSKPISFNFENNSQTNFDFVSNNLIRNTFPYKVADDFAENDFIVETNEIQDQKIEINSISSGSITGFDILSGGSDYKVDEFLKFDNQNTEGDGLLSFISKISGKEIQSIDTTIEKNDNSIITWSENQINIFTNLNHNLKNNNLVKISGLSTDISILNDLFKIGVSTFTTTTISTITASPSAGFTTEIFVSDIPSSVAAGSSIGIGTETLKILNIYRNLNILTIQRDFDSSFETIHPKGSKVEYLTNKFTINKSIPYFDSKVNQKVFFNPAQSIGVGGTEGLATEVSFSFAGQDIKRNIPAKQIFIENHPFKTNQKIKFTRPDSTQISISTESGSSQFNLPSAPEFLYVVRKTPNTIGIKTGIGNNFNEVYFRNINSADSDLYQFETVFDQVIGDIESIKTTVTTTESHELQNNDQISLNLKSDLSVGIGTSIHINVSRDSSTGNVLFNSIGFNSTGINTSSDTITIQDHGLKTGDKIKYESNLIPEGLENKNYFIYKVDDNNVKLCETIVDVKKDIPRITGIGSTGGSTQSISLINPKIKSVKNNNLVFNLSDPSLTGYEFKIYYDQEYKNDFISSGESSIFSISTSGSNGSVGAALTIGYGSSMPDLLYYNLEKAGTISTTDKEVKDYSKISFIDSVYNGSYNISDVTSNSFVVFLNNIPEKLSYNPVECDVLTYDTNSKTAKGSINSIKILSGGSNYKKLPNFVGVGKNSLGKDAVIIPTSSSIGNVNKVRIINEGFEYSSDQTLKPESLIAASVNVINTETLGIVSVTNGGANYIEAPDMIIVNTDTGEEIKSGFLEPVMLENSILSVNITEQPIGLPEKTVTLRTINNTNGIVITEVVSNGSGIFTCKIATPNPVFPIDPFSVGDKVFIEGIEKVGTAGSGFNSSDYGFKLLTVSDYDNGVTPVEVTLDVSTLTSNTGIAVTAVKTFSNIINESDYPSFSITQNQSLFTIGEKLIKNNIPSNLTVSRVDTGRLKIFGKEELKVGDILLGQNSGSQCEISKIVENRGKFKTDFSILKNLNWSDNIGKLDEDFQVVADNDYYQNMSYSIQSLIEWRTLRKQVNNLLHISGMKNFADTEIVSTSPVGVGSTSNVNVVVDLISEKRVDEIKDIDLVRDADVVDNSSRFIQFKNIRLSDFISCDTNDVLTIDSIKSQFSNFQGTPNEFLNIFDFSNLTSNELFNEFLIVVKNPSTTNFDKIQLLNLLVLSNGSKNILVEKSDLINSGIGFTNSESNNFVDFKLVDNNLRFTPNVDLDVTNERDYDLKIFSSTFNTNSVGVGTSSIGPIDLSSRIQTCTAGITTNIITVPKDKFESLYATLHIIDDSTKEMNLVESFISHSNTDTFLSEAYFNTDNNDLSLNRLGIITSSISGNNLILSLENNESNTLKIKSRIIGIGTTGVSDGSYRFKTSGQLDGAERTSLYSGVSTSNIGISTLVNLNSLLFNAVKSIVEVSIGSSRAIHEVLSLHDGTNAYAQQSGSLSVTKDSITEYDPSSGLGTFGANLSGSNFILNFHPDDSSGISTVVSLNHCFYTITDTENTPENLTYGVITENNSTQLYNSLFGNRINKTQFTLKNNSIPIFGKVFNPSDTTGKFISSTGQFNIDNHFFRENEQLVYKPKSTFVGVGSTPMEFKNGSIVDQLPATVFAKNVTDTSFFISTTRAGTAVTFISLGEGNAHELSMAKANEKTLITVDDVAQYPLIRADVTHTLDSNNGQIGLTTTILHLSGISTVSSEDVLKVNDEFMKVVNVGFANEYGGVVGSSGTFNTVEVERSFVGTSATTHSNGDAVNVFRGSYNISGKDIFFTQAPRGQAGNLKTENDLNFVTSNFTGRVYLRNDYSSNVIYDDISNQFTGINSTFTIKVGGANTIGIGTTGGSGIMFVNGIFQSPSTEFNPNKNFKIIESGSGATGVSSVIFTGITSSDGSIFVSNNINTNELPRGGVPISIGNTVNGLGYAPLVGAKVKVLTGAGGTVSSIVGVAYSGSDLGIQTAAYNNITGIITFTTVNEHQFRDSNDFVLIDNMNFTPPLTLRPNEYEVVSVAATNVFGVSVGSSTVSHVYQGSGNLYPFFPNLTFGSGYNGLSPIGVAVTDLGYEHRFVSANTNAISGSLTPTNAVYNPVTGELQLTIPNHGKNTSETITIADRSIFFTCSRDDFRTVHPYPRPTDPASTNTSELNNGVLSIGSTTINTLTVNVGTNVGSGAQVTATAGVGGTAIFSVVGIGTSYKDPQIFVSEPSYSNLSVRGVSRLGIGPTTETGTGLKVNAIVKPVTGIGSTLFEVSGYEIVNRGFGYKKGDVVEAVGLVTAKEMGNLDQRSTLTIDQVYNDSFALWQFGDFDYIDSIKTQQDGSQKDFQLELNNQLISVEVGDNLNENVDIENIFLVIVNGVIQEPKISYNIFGGTIISFVEPPIPEDDITILFYRGTAEEDSEVNLKQKLIIEEGDKVQITQGSGVVEQSERTVFSLETSKKLETNAYLGNGISESVDRPLSLIKQKEDRIINKSLVSKKRSSIEPRITPTAKIISDVKTTGIFYVDDATLFEYETKDENPNDNLIDLSINSRDQIDFVNASATANVSIAGTVSSVSIGIAGTGYDSAPTVKLSAPPLIGVGVGTTATAETTIGVGGTVTGINITNPGLGYTIAPKVLISSPIDYSTTHENITSAVIKNAFGVVTGIGTTTLDGKLAIKFVLEKDDKPSFTPVFPGATDNRPVYISDTRIGTGVTSLSISGNDNDVYAIGESFLDNIYAQASFTSTDNVGVLTCFIKSDTDTTGLTSTGSKSQPVGKFSVSRVMNLTRGSNPIAIGITGRTVGSTTGLSTFPTLKRAGGQLTFEQSGALRPEN